MALAVSAAPARANQDKRMTDRDPDAMDVAKTPVTDLNIDKEEVPELLISAMREPYSLRGVGTCRPLIGAVEELDEILGPDIDLPEEARDRISAGRVAKTVVGSFIPFRGLIREVSGANEHAKYVRAAIQAGIARRGFLKGVGQSRGCKYPGRPATRAAVAAWMAEHQAEAEDKARKKDAKKNRDNGNYVSKPVVQKTN
jgi:hypothetical protein